MSDLKKVNGHHAKDLLAKPLATLPGLEDVTEFPFDVERTLSTIVRLRTEVPVDGYTAPYLGTEREGNGIIIDDNGLILTIGYLIVEAMSISVTTENGHTIPAESVAYDYDSGFGLVRTLEGLDISPLEFGSSANANLGNDVLVAGHGGREAAIGARVVGKREFAGYWEYMLDEAIFTAPAHPNWGGAALIGKAGNLLGIGSLYVEDAATGEENEKGNMFVPIDLLPPIFEELMASGRTKASYRPWMGLFTAEVEGQIVIIGLANSGPAESAGLKVGDIIVKVAGQPVSTISKLYRTTWAIGDAGAKIPMTLLRETYSFELTVKSEDRYSRLKLST